MLLPVGTMALLLQQPLQQHSFSQPDSSFLTTRGNKKVSQPFTVQYNRKIQKPLPVLHHSQALFRSKSLSLLQQHCSCCTRSLTLSPLTLHLLSLLLLFFSISAWRSSRDEAQPSLALPAGSELPKPVNLVQPLHLFCTLLTVCRNRESLLFSWHSESDKIQVFAAGGCRKSDLTHTPSSG